MNETPRLSVMDRIAAQWAILDRYWPLSRRCGWCDEQRLAPSADFTGPYVCIVCLEAEKHMTVCRCGRASHIFEEQWTKDYPRHRTLRLLRCTRCKKPASKCPDATDDEEDEV